MRQTPDSTSSFPSHSVVRLAMMLDCCAPTEWNWCSAGGRSQPGPHRMYIPLSKDLEHLIRRKVESKDYLSAAHVVEEALTLLEERDHMAALREQRLVQTLAMAVSQANSHQLIGYEEVFAGLAAKSLAQE